MYINKLNQCFAKKKDNVLTYNILYTHRGVSFPIDEFNDFCLYSLYT